MASVDVVSEVAGTIWSVEARVGQQLEQDDVVIVVESMKMEIPVCAPVAGAVVEILVSKSDVVSAGDVVARLSDE
jgi:acetyl-CoA carboxylase biotin carboxyl carrier protein